MVLAAGFQFTACSQPASSQAPDARLLSLPAHWRHISSCCATRSTRRCELRAPWQHVVTALKLHGVVASQHGCAVTSRLQQACGRLAQAAATGAAIATLLAAPALATDIIQGPARAVDGDTLEISGNRVRLFGVDAPESKQLCKDPKGKEYLCGQQVAELLKEKLGSSTVTCRVKNKDQYGRSVASCSVGDSSGPVDIGDWLTTNGLAVAYREYSKQYIPDEEAARAAKRGLWAGQFETPSQWRKQNKLAQTLASMPATATGGQLPAAPPPQAAAATAAAALAQAPGLDPTQQPPSPSCAIKGNISSKGTKIYHLPGGRYYRDVQINTKQGERWFCSESEAQAAGWRPSRE